MIERGQGTIVNIASVAGLVAGKGGAAYTASKLRLSAIRSILPPFMDVMALRSTRYARGRSPLRLSRHRWPTFRPMLSRSIVSGRQVKWPNSPFSSPLTRPNSCRAQWCRSTVVLPFSKMNELPWLRPNSPDVKNLPSIQAGVVHSDVVRARMSSPIRLSRFAII